MKKFFVFLFVALMVFCVSGCELLNSQSNENTTRVVMTYNAHTKDDMEKYNVVDSFRSLDGKYYYIYEVGYIDAVPIAIDNSSGMYYSGGDTTLTLTMKKGSVDSISRTVSNISSKTIAVSFGSTVSTEVGLTYAKVGAAIEAEQVYSVTESFESTVSKVHIETEEFSHTVEYSFNNENNEVGFYCYTALASVQLYEIVVYNPSRECVESVAPYSVIGKAFPGLIYSPTSFFDCSPNKINFDLTKIAGFPYPDKQIDDKVEVKFDYNDGSTSITSKEYVIGDKLGNLPTPNRKFYTFNGWNYNGAKATSESVVYKGGTVVADWVPITKRTFTSEMLSSQNGFGTSKEMDTATIPLVLSDIFDVPYLKKSGYDVRFNVKYDVDFQTKLFGVAVGYMKYQFYITNGNRTIYSFNDQITGKTNRVLQSDNIIDYEGTIFINLYTANIQGVKVSNFSIEVEFVI